MSQSTGKFDLNMEEVLEAWDISDAIREIIANALDEQALTETDQIEIYEDDSGQWHIRDYGRGLADEHFTQNEDEEKLNNPETVIGKFGVGLKDALATFHRHSVDVTIHSSHNTFTVEKAPKHGFEDINTLHVQIDSPEKTLQGTEVILDGCTEEDIEEAKRNFLRFSDEDLLEETPMGDVYESPGNQPARIYVNGLRVATEESFLFSYNITKPTKKVLDALNRERSNVGRSAYSRRIKTILERCQSRDVAEPLVSDLESFERGDMHDELSWKPIRLHACKLLNATGDVVFVSPRDRADHEYTLSHAKDDGYRTVTVPENVRNELKNTEDLEGNQIRDISAYEDEYNQSFSYEWVEATELSERETQVWNQREPVLDLLSDELTEGLEIRISETMRVDIVTKGEVRGQWRGDHIVIKRDVLSDSEEFASVLLHEFGHALSNGASDLTREFEQALTQLLGKVAISRVESRER